MELVRLPGIAPELPPWQGGILLLNHNREIKRAWSVHAPGPCHFKKEQTPPGDPSIPARGFTAAVSVFGGTPPPKPLKCKFVLLFPVTRFPVRGHTTSVTIQSSSSPNSVCRQMTSPGCRAIPVHRLSVFR